MQRGGYHAAGWRERSERPEVLQQDLDPLPLQSFGSPMGGGGSPMRPARDSSSLAPFQQRSPPARESSSQAPFQEQASPGRFQPRSRERERCSSPVSFQPRSSPVSFQPQSSPVKAIKRPSPVHYCHHPLDHEENENCLCGQKAGIFISWSDFPGRRYFSCMHSPSDSRRCQNFFKWYDEEAFPQYITNLLGDLRDKVDEQERELVVLRGQLQNKEQKLGDLEEQMNQLWRTT